MFLQTVSNHPAHILNNEGKSSTSSLIPFCSFGEKFIGKKTNEFEIPVCDIFKRRNYFDQICYETNLQDLKESNSEKIEKQLEMGLTLVFDYNEERQSFNIFPKNKSHNMKAPYHKDESSLSVHIDTISRYLN